MRTLRFTGFTLLEYLRSGRVAVEIILTLAVYFIFLRRVGQIMTAEYLYSVLGIFTAALTLYTTAAFIGLGDRPQGYLVLVRGVSRGAYLMGMFLSALTIVAGAYGLLCIGVAVLNRPLDLDLVGWVLGTVPLLLNVGLLVALMIMLSPLVFPTGWRLFVLGLIALAFSSNFIGGTLREEMPETLRSVLSAAQALLGGPLVPAFYGFQLSLTRDYSSATAFVNVLAQLFLLIALLGLAVYSFSRRDLIFSSN